LGSVYIEDLRLAMKTDSQGRAIVRIAFGHIAGKSKVTVGVPVYGVVDSAIYTILPGAGVAARFANHDTAIAVGATLELSAGVVDRIGNLRDDPVTFDVSAGEIAIDGSGSVKGLAIGQAYARIRAEVGGALLRDSIKISVVPKGRLAVTQLTFDGVTIRGFAGEDPHGISIRRAMAPDWSPSGDQIAYVTEGRLGVTDTLGNSEILPMPGIDNATWPQYSADGRWLYFHGTVEQSTQLFRIHPDGTGLESVAEPVIMGAYPSPSPDGVSIVYTSDSAGGVLAVLDIAAGTVRTLPGTGRARMPRWSPSGEWIAYSTLDYEQTMLIRPDGTGHHLLIGKGGQSFDWSPDSRWIIIVQPHSTWLVNVETAEGLEIPGWFEYVSWRP
jgi:hypothetical protein